MDVYVLVLFVLRVLLCGWLSAYLLFFFKQKTAYEMRISDWSSDVCSSDLIAADRTGILHRRIVGRGGKNTCARGARFDKHHRSVPARGAIDRKSTRLNSSH